MQIYVCNAYIYIIIRVCIYIYICVCVLSVNILVDPCKNAWFLQVKDLAVEAQNAQSPLQLQVQPKGNKILGISFINHGHFKGEKRAHVQYVKHDHL